MGLVGVAGFLAVFGLINLFWPYEMTQHQFAISDKCRASNVEPDVWHVKITRICGFVSLFLGVTILFATLT